MVSEKGDRAAEGSKGLADIPFFSKKAEVELEFSHIKMKARRLTSTFPFIEEKEILHGVSGTLVAGQLTAIMGPSGAGKSTLLNILAGYKLTGVQGVITINGQERTRHTIKSFLSQSCYIQQDASLREALTVQESMMVAAELKLGTQASRKEKIQKVQLILKMLGLNERGNTLSSNLSGGQKKRLSIAYELLTNPPIIFLDEPTTGLDSLSCSQCVSLLKELAGQGRTVIATIHQPSALIFEMFDQLFAIADGRCIYNGPTRQLVPFFADKGLPCPKYHNPADYLLEVAIGEHGKEKLEELIIYSEEPEKDEVEEKKNTNSFRLSNLTFEGIKAGLKRGSIFKSEASSQQPEEHCIQPNSFFMELYCLYMRHLIIFQRHWKSRLTSTFAHVTCATLYGLIFFGEGNDANLVRSNLAVIFAVLLFLSFLGLMAVCLKLPDDIRCLRAEHFNRWYSLSPYYLSVLVIEMPLQAINSVIAVSILYIMTNQPLELFRMFFYVVFTTVTSLVAQSFGFFFGVTTPAKVAVFVGPVFTCVLAVFGFTLRFSDTPFIFQLLAYFSYIRSAFHSCAYLLYSFGRQPLDCQQYYCHFKPPEKVLQEMDMVSIDIYSNLVYMIGMAICLHIVTFSILHRRLTKR